MVTELIHLFAARSHTNDVSYLLQVCAMCIQISDVPDIYIHVRNFLCGSIMDHFGFGLYQNHTQMLYVQARITP